MAIYFWMLKRLSTVLGWCLESKSMLKGQHAWCNISFASWKKSKNMPTSSAPNGGHRYGNNKPPKILHKPSYKHLLPAVSVNFSRSNGKTQSWCYLALETKLQSHNRQPNLGEFKDCRLYDCTLLSYIVIHKPHVSDVLNRGSPLYQT